MSTYLKDGVLIEGVLTIDVGAGGDSVNILKNTPKRLYIIGTYGGAQPAYTVNLPNATTLSLYQTFVVENTQISIPIAVKDASGATITTLTGVRSASFTTHSIASAAGDWKQLSGGQGATGVQGLTGIQGQTGVAGVNGATGVAGINGATGLQGITGIGTQGQTGVVGNTGIQGATGVGSSSTIKNGDQAILNGAISVSVVFGVAYPNANYQVTWGIKNTTDAQPQFQPGTLTTQTASGFTISFNAAWDSANYILTYIAIA